MSAYRTNSNTPETVSVREYKPFQRNKKEVSFSKWIRRYNQLNSTGYNSTNCPKDIKKLYREIPYSNLVKGVI